MYQLFLDECAAHMPPPPSSERTWRGSAVVQSSGAASASSSARSRGAVARWALPPLLRAPMGSGKVSISKKSYVVVYSKYGSLMFENWCKQPLGNQTDTETGPDKSTYCDVRSCGGDSGVVGGGDGRSGGRGGVHGARDKGGGGGEKYGTEKEALLCWRCVCVLLEVCVCVCVCARARLHSSW